MDTQRTVIRGDCREIIPTLPAFDVLVTDPPWPNAAGGIEGNSNAHELFAQMWASIPVKPKRAAIILGCDSDPSILAPIGRDLPFVRPAQLRYARPHKKGRILYDSDMVYFFGEPPAWTKERQLLSGGCMATTAGSEAKWHPCPRKLQHMSWIISWWVGAGETLLDPFAGAGTTLLACANHDVEATGIEINQAYCDGIEERLATEYSPTLKRRKGTTTQLRLKFAA